MPSLKSNGSGAGDLLARHLEAVNFLFADGHVKAMKLDSLTAKSSSGRLKFFTAAAED